jgi:energy-coupling factor transport system permease protein
MAKTSNYVQKDSPIDRMDPMVKVYAIFCLGLSSLVFPHYAFSYAIVVLLFVVASMAQLLGKFSKFMVTFAIPIFIMLMFIQGLYSPKNVTILADFGFAQLGLEGVEYALSIIGTLLVFLGSVYLMTTTTYTGKLVASLVASGMNMKIGYLVLASLNVVPQMQRRMSIIQEAQVSRGVETEGGFFSRIKAYIPLLGPVVMSSLTDAQERGMTLETRGFGITDVKPTTYVEVNRSQSDKILKVGLIGFFLVTIAVSIAIKFI